MTCMFHSILMGNYNKDGHEILRVYRDQYQNILRCDFIKDGMVIQRTLAQTLEGRF